MVKVLKKKFREYACKLRESKTPQEDKKTMMNEVYNILCKCFGAPPSEFTWKFMDKNKKYHCYKNLTPLSLSATLFIVSICTLA